MKIHQIQIYDDHVQLRVDHNGESQIVVYRGEVSHQFRAERDGFLTIGISVAPNSGSQLARRSNRSLFDR
jgi:hypothetical protein